MRGALKMHGGCQFSSAYAKSFRVFLVSFSFLLFQDDTYLRASRVSTRQENYDRIFQLALLTNEVHKIGHFHGTIIRRHNIIALNKDNSFAARSINRSCKVLRNLRHKVYRKIDFYNVLRFFPLTRNTLLYHMVLKQPRRRRCA